MESGSDGCTDAVVKLMSNILCTGMTGSKSIQAKTIETRCSNETKAVMIAWETRCSKKQRQGNMHAP